MRRQYDRPLTLVIAQRDIHSVLAAHPALDPAVGYKAELVDVVEHCSAFPSRELANHCGPCVGLLVDPHRWMTIYLSELDLGPGEAVVKQRCAKPNLGEWVPHP